MTGYGPRTELLTREAGLALIEDANRWQAAYNEARNEVARLQDGLDTVDWLLHGNRHEGQLPLTKGERVKRDVVELVRSLLGPEWFKARGIPL